MKKIKALVLLSGGLDSLLAAKILIEQGIETTGLIFKSYFFNAKNAKKAVKQLGIPHQVVDFSKEHLKIVKKPPHGYGKASNPCLDCHLLMLKIANQIKKGKKVSRSAYLLPPPERRDSCDPVKGSVKYDFVATGEVLGERPFSQNKKALEIIAKESGLEDWLLRPLSAQLLPITLPEKKGWVDRDKLLAIQGRRRQLQMELAHKYGFSYPSPSGGCILCEKEFAKKLFDLFEKWPNCNGDDTALLFLGRHFWHGKTKIVLGKNQEENEKLEKMAQKADSLVIPADFPGPTALVRGKHLTSTASKKAKILILAHSPKAPENPKFVVK